MQETQDQPVSSEQSPAARGRSRPIWLLIAGAFAPALVAKYLVPSLTVPLMVLSGIMIALAVGLILRGTPTEPH